VCPKDLGTYVEWTKTTFPQISGKITSKIQWFDQDSSEVLCVSYSFRT
jgi:hypothetical protein